MKQYPISETSSDQQIIDFIWQCHRAEADRDKTVYMKAIRSTLIALGFDQEWVNDRFRELLEKEYL